MRNSTTTTTALLGVTGLLSSIAAAMTWRQLGPVLGWEIEIVSALFMLLAAIVWLPITAQAAGFQLHAPLTRIAGRRAPAVSTPLRVQGYSLADKGRLEAMYTELSRLLTANGANGAKEGLWAQLSTLVDSWTDQRQRQQQIDSEKLLALWRGAYDSSVNFHAALYGESGILKKEDYRNYRDEIAEVLKDSATPSAPVTDHTYLHQLQSGLNGFGVILQALSRAAPLQDPHLPDLIIAAAARADVSFTNTAYMFQDWLSHANRRVLAARDALQR
jgi:hypothetical protein